MYPVIKELILIFFTYPIWGLVVDECICAYARITCKRSIPVLARKQSITLDTNFFSKLEEYVQQTSFELSGGKKIRIVWLRIKDLNDQDMINARAYVGHNKIAVSTKWAELLLLQKSEDTIDTFRETIGHEITHLEHDNLINRKYPLSKYSIGRYIPSIRNRSRFISYCKEVHADYGACMKAFNGNLNKAENCVRFKLRYCSDQETVTHPSFSNRLRYLSIGNFDESMIDLIANDMEYNNKEVISFIKDAYNEDFGKMILQKNN